ncbi:DUF6508 domain-containing protein [Streptomyces sclerotialus]|uniref:DUF6508 domain-containing protein n=1 Tax=Streptomyces sclerotialus TaxID=1957 RepID=UPI0034A4BC55
MSAPVHYIAIAASDGEVVGYAWAGTDDVGWISRKASSSSAYTAATEWYGRLREARERGLAPLGVLEFLGREPGVGPVMAAPDVAAVEELACRVTPADDQRLLAQLDRENPEAWHELADAFDALTDEDRDVKWGGGQKGPSGAIQVPYPLYSEGLDRAIFSLARVGAVTPEHRWMDNPVPQLSPDGRLRPADAVRAATAIVRGERFCDGTIANAVRDGLLDAVAESLRTWYERETAPTGRTAAPAAASAAATSPGTQDATCPASHDTENIITTPPAQPTPPRTGQPQPTPPHANPYAQPQQAQSQYGYPQQPQYGYPQQPQYGMPPAPYGMSPQGGQPYGVPQQGTGPYGGQPGQEACRFCGGMPAVRVTFRAHQGFLILMRFLKYDGPMCGNCGLAVHRAMTTATLWQGWWSPFSLFIFTPFTLIWNLVARRKVSKLPHPAPGQHGQRKDPGKPVYQRPLAYVALIPVLWIFFMIFQGLSQS